ncbi:Clavaminate synthase-like protein [Paramyrothecium foliicola]|nr:Clavaminate synthase-like protein [Paramyrothecium foliicola]
MATIPPAFQEVSYGPAVHLTEPYENPRAFPLSLGPVGNAPLPKLIADVQRLSKDGTIRKHLNEHGGIYFQGLGLQSAEEFSQFAHAFGWTPHEDIGNPGVKYQLFYPNGPRDQVSSAGTTVLQAYGKNVTDEDDVEVAREKVETEIRRLPTATWAWENQTKDNRLGDLRVWQHLPAVRIHEQTGLPAFFNNTVSRYLNALSAGTLQPPHINKEGKFQPPAFYGDGSLIPEEYFDSAVEIINNTRSLVSWTRGDVLLLDNHAIQHAREPWEGPRKLLASLWDEPAKVTA